MKVYKRFFFLSLLLLTAVLAQAQERKITGTLYDGEMKEAVPYAAVQLLKNDGDSTYVTGVTSDEKGQFTLQAPKDGSYVLRASYVGYKNITQNITISNSQNISVGLLEFNSDTHVLKEVTVTARPPKVVP